ncbi:MAG TPA: MBOAT family O-acyltransferase [Steroidobacteraceae bacterium]|nr:MBOAT family O-acyltransferase [Steroidobacteraceae bacterium]
MAEQDVLQLVLASSSAAVIMAWLPWRALQPWLIALCGAGLLAMASPTSLALLAVASVVTFVLQRRGLLTRYVLLVSVTIIAGAYLLLLARSEHSSTSLTLRVVLPLGMAFYALRLIHYLLEAYKGHLRPHTLGEYLSYHFLPATLPAGPIHRFDDYLRDLRRKRWDSDRFSYGGQRILYGLVKLVVLGNYLIGEELTPLLAGASGHPLLHQYLSVLLFWARLYVLFSGYSDIAVGFGALMGLRIRENFNWPIVARNIADFWQRWHITLAGWCREYVYAPVVSVTRRPFLAVMASMIVLGIWHDLSLHYLLWGAYHGAGIAGFRWFDARAGESIAALPPLPAALWRVFACVITLHFVLFSFWVTRAVERVLIPGAG